MQWNGEKASDSSGKGKESCKKIWRYRGKCVSLQRQEEILDYPGKFPARGKPSPTLPIFIKRVVLRNSFLFGVYLHKCAVVATTMCHLV